MLNLLYICTEMINQFCATFLKKSIDKLKNLCYNIITKGERHSPKLERIKIMIVFGFLIAFICSFILPTLFVALSSALFPQFVTFDFWTVLFVWVCVMLLKDIFGGGKKRDDD